MHEEIRRFASEAEFHTAELCWINELSNTASDPQVSIARARVPAGVTTRWHRLTGIAERYVILQGAGRVEIGSLPPHDVGPGDVVLIPPGCRQRIANSGTEELVFLALCTPRFRPQAYEDLEHAPRATHDQPDRTPMEIRRDDLRGPEIALLLQEHLRNMALHSPPESVHALDLDRLRRPEITFWTVWHGNGLMGCGAIKELDATHAEIKSMRTAAAHLRKGVAARLMRHILDEARRRSYRRLSLETGSAEAFAPARSLYASFGFEPCGPFADYVEDPYSVFMTRLV